MTVNIQDANLVILDNTHQLDNVAKSQLSFWQFLSNSDTNLYIAPLNKQIFLKLIRYLEKENIEFELSPLTLKYSQDLAVRNLGFENVKLVAEKYKNGIFDIIQFDSFREFVISNIKRSLKHHQLKAAFHLYILGNGANFSVPGSGKTSVVLTVYEKLRLEGKVNTLFVVGPPSSFGPWKNEFQETLGRRANFKILAGGNKSIRKNSYYDNPSYKAELYLTSFHSLLSDQKDVTHFLKQKHVRAFFVVDEAHYIKQIKGNWAQAILKQSERAKYRCVLTGTPMPKSYTDVFNLFDFLWPANEPLSSNEKTRIKYSEEKDHGKEAKRILVNKIGPLFYRVRKIDLNLTEQNFHEPEQIQMGKYEQIIYDAVFQKIKSYSQKDFFKNIDFINKLGRGRIMRLRQAVSYSKLLISAIEGYEETLFEDLTNIKNIIKQYDKLEIPGKIKFLIKKVKFLSRKKLKVVIWSNFIETINLIERHLKEEGLNCKKIFGKTPIEGALIKEEETRERIRDEFVDPDSGLDILIANPAACAESISLHKTCHHAIYYDLTYNCAQYLQSLDRIHRVGGSEITDANYYFLQYKNTIDIDIKANLDKKKKKMFNVIEEDYNIYSLNMFDDDGDEEAYLRLIFNKKNATRY